MPAIKDIKGSIMKMVDLDGSPESWQEYKTELMFIDKCTICGKGMQPGDDFGELGYIVGNTFRFLKLCSTCFESVHLLLSKRRNQAKEKDKFLRRIHEKKHGRQEI